MKTKPAGHGLYVSRLGPIETDDEGRVSLYPVFVEGTLQPELFTAGSDAQALAEVAKRYPAAPIRCSPRMRAAAGARGGKAAEPPPEAALGMALLAHEIAFRNDGATRTHSAGDFDTALGFVTAAAAFVHAAPWEHWSDGVAIPLEVSVGGERKRWAAVVLGAGGMEFGLGIYEDPALHAMLADAAEEEQVPSLLRDGDTFAMLLADEPGFVVEVMEECFGIDAAFTTVRSAHGEQPPLDTPRKAVLALAMAAVADAALELTGERRGDDPRPPTSIALEGGEVRVELAEVPEPDCMPEDPDPALDEAVRSIARAFPKSAPCLCGSGKPFGKCCRSKLVD